MTRIVAKSHRTIYEVAILDLTSRIWSQGPSIICIYIYPISNIPAVPFFFFALRSTRPLACSRRAKNTTALRIGREAANQTRSADHCTTTTSLPRSLGDYTPESFNNPLAVSYAVHDTATLGADTKRRGTAPRQKPKNPPSR